ncbi:TAT-variant-translocated molybdopterin oxidoreductase [Chondromyces apiculatus]|uniref:Molybdopterin oxidoreductase, iron-sulfur binding protein subunit n=1 Tax=Chondromyces apiculatus DSM 436 TaxID=1192034 RepID=A0A017TB75_9BACT|nr:TAT-variant-translocated molybdopterin oxidoreductase [Chondromyces apiculatus]EYF06494.1 Molybdopterin oxidoreductase, iron-sulfur binding protein subunit [Chondromyces apiculatus DSM 436]
MKRVPLPLAPEDPNAKRWWRSLGEHAGSPEFKESLPAEFPPGAALPPEGEGRRQFLTVMGASAAIATLAGCRRPEEHIMPYTRRPEEVVEGNPLYFATTFPFQGTAYGLLVESHEGRPTKVEGNPQHPESLGTTTLWSQAFILDLYDPDRTNSPRNKGQTKTWAEASDFLRAEGERLKAQQGKGLVVLTESHRSPSLAAQLRALREALPQAKVVRYEPFSSDNAHEGERLAFGRPLSMSLDLAKAKTIVTLDADVLSSDGSTVRQARGFVAGRDVDKGVEPNRLYVIESHLSTTGGSADHRLRIQSRQVPAFAFALAAELGKLGVDLGAGVAAAAEPKGQGLSEKAKRFVVAIAKELAGNRGRGVVVAGRKQPAEVHAVAHLINQALDAIGEGKPVRFHAAFDEDRDGPTVLTDLAASIGKNEVETLLILGGNPVFNAPADARFAEAIGKVRTSIHLSTVIDETSEKTTWHLNRTHLLEAWGDARSVDGTQSIVQPLIAPLFDGKSELEVLEMLLGGNRSGYDMVRATALGKAADAEKGWRKALHDGVWAGSASPVEAVTPAPDAVVKALGAFKGVSMDGLEVTFRPDDHAYDGRFANNAWLQELPDPSVKQTWGNAAGLSFSTANKLGVKDGDVITVSGAGGSITIPVAIMPGQADDSISLTFGQGRRAALRVAHKVGVDTGPIRQSAGFDVASGFSAQRTGGFVQAARTQEHFSMEGRPVAREGSYEEFKKDPTFAKKEAPRPELFNLWTSPVVDQGHAWGMAIDLNACLGCSACVTACQAENNTPVVGPDGVTRSREMHWLRIDRYYDGSPDEPETISQPMLCQHCESAPCEQVCPVAATTHSPEGLNDMAYNRCIGTRYCANNCPFKVRRFNYFHYNKDHDEFRKLQFNPEVTVRSRGVMEKCTFCVQRINRAKIEAKRDGKTRVEDGKIATACQAACPTQAITFGDLNDPKSAVSERAASARGYKLLEDINVKPRITYLARIRNRNPELEGA